MKISRFMALVCLAAFAAGCGGAPSGFVKSDGNQAKNKNAALDDVSGLNVSVYRLDTDKLDLSQGNEWGQGLESQIVRDDSFWTKCDDNLTSVPNLEGLGDVFSTCGSEYVLVHYSGYITAPGEGDVNVALVSYTDDGFFTSIDGQTVVDGWQGQECTDYGNSVTLTANEPHPIDVWYYQYRGDYCMQVQWDLGEGYSIVPTSAFSRTIESVTSTTVEEATTTTVEEATTTTSGSDTSESTTPSTSPAAPTSTEAVVQKSADSVTSVAASIAEAVRDPENVKPIEASPEGTDYECDTECVDALRAALGITGGNVVVDIGGTKSVLNGDATEKIKVVPGASITFSAEEGTESIAVPVVEAVTSDSSVDSNATPVPDYKLTSDSNAWVIYLLIAIVAIFLLLFVLLKRRAKSEITETPTTKV